MLHPTMPALFAYAQKPDAQGAAQDAHDHAGLGNPFQSLHRSDRS